MKRQAIIALCAWSSTTLAGDLIVTDREIAHSSDRVVYTSGLQPDSIAPPTSTYTVATASILTPAQKEGRNIFVSTSLSKLLPQGWQVKLQAKERIKRVSWKWDPEEQWTDVVERIGKQSSIPIVIDYKNRIVTSKRYQPASTSMSLADNATKEPHKTKSVSDKYPNAGYPPKSAPTSAQTLKASPVKVKPIPVKTSTSASKRWEVKSGENLQKALHQWAASENWQLVWDVDRNFALGSGAVFYGDLKEAVKHILDGVNQSSDITLNGSFYRANRVLRIHEQVEGGL